jgi:hypothetical protein
MLQWIDSDVPSTSPPSLNLSNAFPTHVQSPFSEIKEIAPERHEVEYIMSHWTAHDSPPVNVPFEFVVSDAKEATAGVVHQRVRLTALADTGAFDGYMTADFCTRHRIPYIPTPSSGRVMLGDGKSHVSRLGYTAPLQCYVGTRVFLFSFAVLTTGSHDVFLGRRFLSDAGIHLANVPRGFASDEVQEL